jgi:cytochrome c-type biogenesis protein CcmE
MSNAAAQELGLEAPRPRIRLLVAGLVIFFAVGLVAYIALRTQSTSAYYVGVGELAAKREQGQARVLGKVLPGSIQRLPDGTLKFTAYDAGGRLPVTYNRVVPDVFNDDVEVVVEGKLAAGGEFQAHTLLAKCPSKFEAQTSASGVGSQ